MRKNFLVCLIMLGLSLGATYPVQAQVDVKTLLTYGSTTYDQLIDQEFNVTEWSAVLSASYQYEDLMFNALYSRANSLSANFSEETPDKSGNFQRSAFQIGANYRFLEESPLTLYGGIGYKVMGTNINHAKVRDNKFKLSGHNFVGQAAVQIDIAEGMRAEAIINGTPWFSWEYVEQVEKAPYPATKDIQGNTYDYQVGFSYDVTPDYGVQLGVSGGSYSVSGFKVESGEIPKTKASFAGVSLGVIWRF